LPKLANQNHPNYAQGRVK